MAVFLLGLISFRQFPNFSTLYGARYFTFLLIQCLKDNSFFRPFRKKKKKSVHDCKHQETGLF